MEATVKEYILELLEDPKVKDTMITRRAMEMVAYEEGITAQQLEERLWSRPREDVMANPEDARVVASVVCRYLHLMAAKYPEAMIDNPERVTSYVGRYGNAIETAEGANVASLLLTCLNAISCDRTREGVLRALIGQENPDLFTQESTVEHSDAVDEEPGNEGGEESTETGPKRKSVKASSRSKVYTAGTRTKMPKAASRRPSRRTYKTQERASAPGSTTALTAQGDHPQRQRIRSLREGEGRYGFRATSILKVPKYRQWGV